MGHGDVQMLQVIFAGPLSPLDMNQSMMRKVGRLSRGEDDDMPMVIKVLAMKLLDDPETLLVPAQDDIMILHFLHPGEAAAKEWDEFFFDVVRGEMFDDPEEETKAENEHERADDPSFDGKRFFAGQAINCNQAGPQGFPGGRVIVIDPVFSPIEQEGSEDPYGGQANAGAKVSIPVSSRALSVFASVVCSSKNKAEDQEGQDDDKEQLALMK